MVLPEGSPAPGTDRPSTPRLIAVGAALAVLLGAILVLGQVTAPPEEVAVAVSTTTTEPISRPTTTTTIDVDEFSISDITTGDGLAWINAPGVGRVWPLDLVSHDGMVYLFGSTAHPHRQSESGALQAWVSENGIKWVSLGDVAGNEYRIHRVVSTTAGLVALGARLEDNAPHIWTSSDGDSWAAEELPKGVETGPGEFVRLSAATELDGRLVVFGTVLGDFFGEIARHLPEEVADHVPYGLSWSAGPDGARRITVRGPLGIIGFTATPEELGISDEVASSFFDPSRRPEAAYRWSSRDGTGWEVEESDLWAVENFWPGPDGLLLASSGPRVWSSSDGLDWEVHGTSSRAHIHEIQIREVWEGLLIGSGIGEHLFQSRDGIDWEQSGTGDLLPDQLQWDLGPVAAGEAGLATVATAWHRVTTQEPFPVIIEKEGHILTVDMRHGIMTLDDPEDITITIPLWSDQPSEHVTVDFLEEQVTFHHPDTDEPMVSFGFATLERVETSAMSLELDNGKALLFTADGQEWSLQDLTRVIGENTRIADLAVLDDRVILITHPFTRATRSSEPPNLSIRVGVIRSDSSG